MSTPVNCKDCHRATKHCPKCGNACILAKGYIDNFNADEQPFCGEECGNNKYTDDEFTIAMEIPVYILYCLSCNKTIDSWVEK